MRSSIEGDADGRRVLPGRELEGGEVYHGGGPAFAKARQVAGDMILGGGTDLVAQPGPGLFQDLTAGSIGNCYVHAVGFGGLNIRDPVCR